LLRSIEAWRRIQLTQTEVSRKCDGVILERRDTSSPNFCPAHALRRACAPGQSQQDSWWRSHPAVDRAASRMAPIVSESSFAIHAKRRASERVFAKTFGAKTVSVKPMIAPRGRRKPSET
jgi:hypothetical protein